MNKNFDAVRWMRNARERIDNEDKRLTWQEKSKKTKKNFSRNPLWLRLQGCIAGLVGNTTVKGPRL